MDDRVSSTATGTSVPAATAEATVTAPSTPPQTVTAPAATVPADEEGGQVAPSAEEAQEGGAGDEEGIRVPVDLTVSADAVSPATASVPAFLPLEVSVTSGDGEAHRVEVAGETIGVPPGGSASTQIGGLRRGTYPVAVDGTPRGELVAGDEPGP